MQATDKMLDPGAVSGKAVREEECDTSREEGNLYINFKFLLYILYI